MQKLLFTFLSICLFLTACNSNDEKVSDDLKDFEKIGDIYYKKFTSHPDSAKIKMGDALFQQVGWGTKDSVVMPIGDQHFTILTNKLLSQEVVDIYELMNEGDSLTMVVPPKVFFRLYGSIPMAFSDNEPVYYTVKINKVISNDVSTFKTSASGSLYKITNSDSIGKKSFDGCVQFQQNILASKDSIISMEPAYPVLLSKESFPPEIYDVLMEMSEGQFATIVLDPSVLFEESEEVKQTFGVDGKVYLYVSLQGILTRAEFETMMQQEQAAAGQMTGSQKEMEAAAFQEYMKVNNLEGKTTKSGLVIITEKMGYGKMPAKGQKVKVHYRGYFLDGTTFDSSYDRGTPAEFPLGEGYVISGWDEGIATMKVGGKAKLLIPSNLGYGKEERSGIPPNSPLIFDVELLSVE
ncbi:MAG: FKBP-type peptidyl-prolyl cis-trans isomerase [Bacteroidales bacterium]|nr:FKBP-type peptidyl-prolyl cis-trans isomerase [Bacteroidales bacterium]